jgi:hypothetical protein
MPRTVHVIDPGFSGGGKMVLMMCPQCEAETLHTTPFFGHPFRCVANHGGETLCDSCKTYVDQIAKIVVEKDGRHIEYCELCAEPDSPEKVQRVEERRKKAAEDLHKTLDADDPQSIARSLGASSIFVGKK